MPEIQVAATGPSLPFSTVEQVKDVLGPIGQRPPLWVDFDRMLSLGHSIVVDTLANVYPNGIPAFDGDALTIVELAEAKLAAAEVLDAVRVNYPDAGEQAADLRASAFASLVDGVLGYPAGSSGVDSDGDGVPDYGSSSTPRVSSFTPLSAFPDPYAEARGLLERFE